MTLKEFLETADKQTEYFIGGGSGYLTIGTPEEIDIYDLSKQEKHRLAMDAHEAEQAVAAAESRLEAAKHLASTAKRKFENFVPFENREIAEIYISPCYGNHCVIIQGNENGEFWTKKEIKIKKAALAATSKIMDAVKSLAAEEGIAEKTAAKALQDCLSALKLGRETKGENNEHNTRQEEKGPEGRDLRSGGHR